jgi:hypothetical protein
MRPYVEKNFSQNIGLVEWLKMKALSASTSTAKNNNKQTNKTQHGTGTKTDRKTNELE